MCYSWLQALFESCILIFSVHPFDVGDCLTVDGTWLKVRKIGLNYCGFDDSCNRRVYVPTAKLYDAKLVNLSRSAGVWLGCVFVVGTYARHERGPKAFSMPVCKFGRARTRRVSAQHFRRRVRCHLLDCVVASARADPHRRPDMGLTASDRQEIQNAVEGLMASDPANYANPSEKPPTVLVSAIEPGLKDRVTIGYTLAFSEQFLGPKNRAHSRMCAAVGTVLTDLGVEFTEGDLQMRAVAAGTEGARGNRSRLVPVGQVSYAAAQHMGAVAAAVA